MLVGVDGEIVGVVAVADTLKPEAARGDRTCQGSGLRS